MVSSRLRWPSSWSSSFFTFPAHTGRWDAEAGQPVHPQPRSPVTTRTKDDERLAESALRQCEGGLSGGQEPHTCCGHLRPKPPEGRSLMVGPRPPCTDLALYPKTA